RRGHRVRAIALAPNPEGAKLPPEMELEFRNYLTLSDDEIRKCFDGCEGFVFATGVDERIDGPSPIFDFYNKYNLVPLEKFLRIAKECGVKHTVICGSYFSHFDKIWPWMELGKWHPYIRSRIAQEMMAMSFAGRYFNVAVLELPYIFGVQPGREPVWTVVVNVVRGMKCCTMFPKGGTAMVTRKQVAQALAGALEKSEGGKCWPIGYYNMAWKEFLAIVHKNMGMPNRKVITIPNWLFNLGIKSVESRLRVPGSEGGLYMPKFAELQSSETFVDKSLGCVPLGVQDDDLETAIGESVRMAADVLDGKVKNVIGMKGE
ncbi:MAG: nucleoside-diphosphate sugar epimerase, partial [Treponema sp.]|nr:nucleoside-diphosphate sugar epimerase [Treponema sp.]